MPRTFYGWRIDTIYTDEDYRQVAGYDVMEPGSHADDEPWAELVPTLTECRAIIRDEVRFRRVFATLERLGG